MTHKYWKLWQDRVEEAENRSFKPFIDMALSNYRCSYIHFPIHRAIVTALCCNTHATNGILFLVAALHCLEDIFTTGERNLLSRDTCRYFQIQLKTAEMQMLLHHNTINLLSFVFFVYFFFTGTGASCRHLVCRPYATSVLPVLG